MPLFNRRLYHRNENDEKSDGNDSTYSIEHTGETFQSRDLFEKVKKIYELERWTCQCTWRASLTHRDAFQSEIETRKSLSTLVPTYFNKTILEIVHHSVKPLDKLAEEVSNVLGQGFAIGEPVQFKKRKDSNVVKGVIERIEENDEPRKRTSERASVQARILSDKQMKNVKYVVRLIDEDRVISNVQPNELQRCALIPNREKLKTFIRSFAIRLGNRVDSPWIFYDDDVKKQYEIKDRLDSSVIETLRQGMIVTLDEILREQDRLQRKQSEEETNGHVDEVVIRFSDDEQKKSPKKKSKSPSKAKKQLTLHEMKFTKSTNGNSNELLLQKSPSTKTSNVAVPYSLLQKLDKTRRDRGVESRLFQRLILHCARTLNEKQRTRLPDEYRSLIQSKFEELELKRRLAEMTEQEKKSFLQTKQKEKQLARKPQEDLDLSSSKTLPLPKPFDCREKTSSSHSIGDLLLICTFFSSCQSLFVSTLADELPKSSQQFLRKFRHEILLDAFVSSSSNEFFQYFIELLQILMKFLLKEDEQRDEVEEQDQIENETNFDDQRTNSSLNNDDFEQIYDVKLIDIPLTPFTCLELTRLYLSKSKDESTRSILQYLNTNETKDFNIEEQIDLLLFLVNFITTDNEFMSEYFEYLTRTMSETYRERNQLLAERRKVQEEESKQKKLQLQNGENEKISSKKLLTPKQSQTGTTNDENHQTSPVIIDEHLDSDDDLKSVTQRRRQMVAMSKELKEKKDLEIQKAYQEQKRQMAIEKAEQNYQDALLNLQFGFRIKPLGFDRYYNRYWFFKGYAGLFVEKGWCGEEISYCTQENSSSQRSNNSTLNNGEKHLPKHEENQWWKYDNQTSIEQLISSLNDRGIREQNLLQNLKKTFPLIQNEFEQMKNENSTNIDDSNSTTNSIDILAAFKADLEDIEARLRHGSLGGFIVNENLDEWLTKLKQTNERTDLAELLIQLQQTVAEKYATGIFGTHERQTKISKNLSKKKSLLPKSSLSHAHQLQIWMNDCRTCKTSSRLYVLMMIFENSIAWNKSAAGLKCKVCRRKNKDDYIVVCDQCCQGYHLECLRGYANEEMKNSHHDLWFCPACAPQPISKRRTQRRVRRKNDYYDTDIYEMDVENQSNEGSHERDQHDLSDVPSEQSDPTALDGEDDDDGDGGERQTTHDDDHCCICGAETSNDNELIQCIQCRQSYHCQCHEPPLRCAPRSTTWMCSHCRNGVNNETTRRIPPRRQMIKKKPVRKDRIQPTRSARKNYRETDEDDEESDYEDQIKTQRRSKRLRQVSPMSSDESDEKSDQDDDENEQQEQYQRTRRRVRIAKSTSESSEEDEPAQEDVEESDMIDDENVQMISS